MRINPALLREQFQSIKIQAQLVMEGLTDEQFNWRPAPHLWSMAQCFDHLNIFGREYLPKISHQIAQAQNQSTERAVNFRLRLFASIFLKLTEPPIKAKVKAPKLFQPVPDHALLSVRDEFDQLQDALVAVIQRAETLDWSRIKVTSPVTSLLQFNLTEILAITAAHERRHLWQAKQLRQHPNFPMAA